jgi:Rod binding domain-containing protein
MSPVLAISPWDLSAQQAQASRLKRTGDTREQLTEAARGFENILIRKWIEVARKASIDPKQGPAASYETMVDDQLAFLVSKQGGVGFVQPMVEQMMAQVRNRIHDPDTQSTESLGTVDAVQKLGSVER